MQLTLLQKAANYLREDKLVAFPTETVYGLGGNALSDKAVAAIYAAKGRPDFNPLIVHVSNVNEAKKYAEFNEAAEKLAQHFWPGPLTLVLKRRVDCALSLLVSAGMDTVAMRVPAHDVAQALLLESGLPIAAPSANRSGRISPTEAAHVEEELGDRVDMILDGGACQVGIESTVVDMTGEWPVVLRPGSISAEALDCHPERRRGNFAARKIDPSTTLCYARDDTIKSPGMLASHYAPDCTVRLNATSVEASEALLAFGQHVPQGAFRTENLSSSGDLKEAAANLFRMLRILDGSGVKRIAVMPIPETELGIAINDRLKRAASPRS